MGKLWLVDDENTRWWHFGFYLDELTLELTQDTWNKDKGHDDPQVQNGNSMIGRETKRETDTLTQRLNKTEMEKRRHDID